MKGEAVAVRSLILANRRKIAALTMTGPQANQEEIENLVDTNRELAETVHTLQTDAFGYFEKLLSLALVVK